MDTEKKDVTKEETKQEEVKEEVVNEVTEEVSDENAPSMQEQLNSYYTSVTGLQADVHVDTVDPKEIKKKKIILIVALVVLLLVGVLSFVLFNKGGVVRRQQEEKKEEDKELIDNSEIFGNEMFYPKFELKGMDVPKIVEDSCDSYIVEGITWSYCLDEYGNAINVHSLDSLSDEVDVPGILDGHMVIEVGLRDSNRQMSLCSAKASCRGIKGVTIPEGVLYLSNYLFYHLESLVYVTLPDTIKYIGNYAFSNCTELERVNSDTKGYVVLPRSLIYYGTNLFSYDNVITDFDFPAQIDYINSYTFYHCEGFRSLAISGQYEVIFPGAFSANSKLRSVEFGDGVGVVSGFSGDSSLREVKMPNSVYAIGEKAFAGCVGMEKFEYNGKLRYLGKYIFANTDIDINKFLTKENLDFMSLTMKPDDVDFDIDDFEN